MIDLILTDKDTNMKAAEATGQSMAEAVANLIQVVVAGEAQPDAMFDLMEGCQALFDLELNGETLNGQVIRHANMDGSGFEIEVVEHDDTQELPKIDPNAGVYSRAVADLHAILDPVAQWQFFVHSVTTGTDQSHTQTTTCRIYTQPTGWRWTSIKSVGDTAREIRRDIEQRQAVQS